MDVSYVCTGIPDGEWASKGCRLEWERDFGGQCPVCRGELKAVAVKTVTPNLKEETIMTTITNGPVKPVIPNDVADAIEDFRRDNVSNEELVMVVQRRSHLINVTPRLAAVRSLPFDALLAALVNGYEREQTAEQIAHEKIRNRCGDFKSDLTTIRQSYIAGIKFTLDTLGVKITEVNA